ncbi:high mobility group B protein 2-like [Mangifera indica]|uniref:high mobility group B protein 2-like n=1 Tax=Mangifera indica TaxID=29780 RepID=UPI001CFB6134|nr:high mobility group B protein 2-like [Mangifera indica]XP_044470605.1 high mobility group B protein 2-like [Mangifera indica]
MKGKRSRAHENDRDTKLKSRGAGAGKRKAKAAKDPNKPKRPPSAFFVFMEEFRQLFKRENPNNKSVAAVGKAAGEKWKSMSDAEKAPYVARAESRKNDYSNSMKAYNKKLAEGDNGVEENESDKSKSEVKDEDEDGTEQEDEHDD